MRRTIPIFTWALLCAYGAPGALSQGITIETADVQSMHAIGNTISLHMDTLTTTADIGALGQTSWDFSGLQTTSLKNLESVPVASTPYAASVPQATHALRDAAFTYSFYYASLGTTITLVGTGYVYYAVGDYLLNYGLKGAGNAYLYGNPYPAQGQWLNSPAPADYALPLQLSKSWITAYTESISGSANLGGITVPFGPLETKHAITYFVDAYGTLTLPGGRVHEALRIRKLDRYGATATDKLRVGYIFLAKNGATVQVTVSDTSVISGTASVHSVQWMEGSGDAEVPITLVNFTATAWDGGSVKLEWATLSETNNFGFYIQKRGSDEREFRDLPGSFVAGHGTTIVPQKYSYLDTPAAADVWWYRLKQLDLDGTVHFSEPIQVKIVSSVQECVPMSYEITQNYPNPFNPSTTIRYGLPYRSHVRLAVFSTLGQQVATLVDAEVDAGYHEVRFDAAGCASGVYFCRLHAGGYMDTKKLVLAR